MNDSDSDTAMIQWIDMVRASVACATIGRARMVTLALQVFNQPSSAHPNPRTVPVSRAESPILYSESNSPSQKSLLSEAWYWMYSKIVTQKYPGHVSSKTAHIFPQ